MAESDLSAEVNGVTPLPPPTIGGASVDSGGNVDLSWTNTDDSSDGGIDVERSTDGFTSVTTVVSGLSPSTTSYTDTSVTSGTTYSYRIERNTDHATATSAITSVTTPTFATGTSTITLTPTGVIISAFNSDTGTTTVSLSPSGLITLRESLLSGEAGAITFLPAPSNFTIDYPGGDSATLNWTNADDSPDGDIEIQRSENNGSFAVIDTVTPTTVTYSDSVATGGPDYSYRINRVTDHAAATSGTQAIQTFYRATTTAALDSSGLVTLRESLLSGERDAITVLPETLISDVSYPATETGEIEYTTADDSTDGDVTIERSTDAFTTATEIATGLALGTQTITDSPLTVAEEYQYRAIRQTDHATTTGPAVTLVAANGFGTAAAVLSQSGEITFIDTIPDHLFVSLGEADALAASVGEADGVAAPLGEADGVAASLGGADGVAVALALRRRGENPDT